MACDHDMVESPDAAVAVADFDAVVAALHGGDAGGEPDAVFVVLGQALDIGSGTAADRPPLRTVAQPQQAVAVLESDER